jgi:hypothetical protein
MSKVRFQLVHGADVAPFVPRLRALERSIEYPLGDGADHFFIDHGEQYHPFFSALGDARFLLALRGDEVLGSIAGVARTVRIAGRDVPALYLCDLKLARAARGQGLSRRLLLHGLGAIVRTPEVHDTRLLYGAAMRGAAGDVMRTARGFNPLRLGRPAARLALYFVSPARLATLDLRHAPPPPTAPGADLGPSERTPCEPPGLCSTAGRKDLRLVSSGAPWPLVHLPLGPSAWRPTWGAYLRECGQALAARGVAAQACFAIDERLRDHTDWLAGQGVAPGAVCTVYWLSLAFPPVRPAWVHVPTSEI